MGATRCQYGSLPRGVQGVCLEEEEVLFRGEGGLPKGREGSA